jgi:hypothetical protein
MSENQNLNKDLIYLNNKRVNKEKSTFWKFLMYTTKAEIHINSFTSLLYWVSITEIFLFAMGFILFISSPSNFSIFWAFITHVIRAALGFIILKRLPRSHVVIEELKEFENDSLEDVENKILEIYRNLLQNNESRLKTPMIWYFVFTIIDILVDNILFFYLTTKWQYDDYSLQNMIALVLIVSFFSIINIQN